MISTTALNVYNKADGVTDITGTIDNATGMAKLIGGSIVFLVVVVVGIMILGGALSAEGSMRKHLGKIMVVAVGALVIGGGTYLGGALVKTGEQLTPDKSNSTVEGTVN